jgi:hypothetical protein
MRTKWATIVCAVLTLGFVLCGQAAAHPLTVAGSLTIAKSDGGDLGTSLVGFAVIANPGFEKSITIHIPPFTLPVFIDGDREDGDDDDSAVSSSSRLVRRRFDTTVVLTNTTESLLGLKLTVRDGSGAVLANAVPVSLEAHETKVIPVSDLLP